MTNKQSFNDFVAGLPKLKQVDPKEKLPSYFDLMWDIKYGYQLIDNLKRQNNPDIYSALAKYGYDAASIKKLTQK